MNAKGCRPSPWSCINTAPTVALEASVTTVYGSFGSGNRRIGASHNFCFSWWNASFWYDPHWQSTLFLSTLSLGGLLRQIAECIANSDWPSQERSTILYILERIPFLHSFGFSWTHTSLCHLLPKELDALVSDLALWCLCIELMIL